MKNTFYPNINDRVSVCYDGKIGRAVDGVVVKRRGFAIQVMFDEWGGDTKNIKQWFVRISPRSFGAFVPLEGSLMKAAFGTKGDWYSVICDT